MDTANGQSTQPKAATPAPHRPGKVRLRLWHGPEFLLAAALVASLATILFVVLSSLGAGRVTLLDAGSFEPGRWNGAGPLFVYHQDTSILDFVAGDEGPYLSFRHDSSKQWEGFGIMGDLSVPITAWLRIDWRNNGPADRFISLFVTDKSPDQSGHGRPENYMSNILLPAGGWTQTIVPLSQFVRNSWQERGASEDGVMNTGSLQKVEAGLGPSEPTSLDIRAVELVWENPPSLSYLLTPILGFLACLFILLFRKPSQMLRQYGNVAESRTALALSTLFALAALWSQPAHEAVDWVPQAILGLNLLVALVDEIFRGRFQQGIWWRLRFIFAPCLYLLSAKPAALLVDAFFLPILLPPLLRQKNVPAFVAGLLASLGLVLVRQVLVGGSIAFYPAIIMACEGLMLFGIYWYLQLKTRGLDSHIASHLYQGVLALTQDMIIILDEEGRIEHMNQGAETTLGTSAGQARGRAMEDLFTMKVNWKTLLDQLQNSSESRSLELQTLDDSGGRTFYSVRIQRYAIERWQSRFILMLRDISRQKHLEEELRAANARLSAIAFLDGLTGIASRRAFDQSMDMEWKRSRRSRTPLGLLLIDVDHFKAYNDACGHLKGDEALRLIASCLKSFARRPEDVCARYGGEEFVLLFPGMTKDNLSAMAEQIRAAVELLKLDHPATHGLLTISIGGVSSSASPSESTPSGLIHAADTALYKAKNDGRNRCVITQSNSGSI